MTLLSLLFFSRWVGLSLGEGQEHTAERTILEGVDKGTWVILLNCHLVPKWMDDLDHIFRSISEERVRSHINRFIWV